MSDLPAAWQGYFAGQQNVRANEHQNLQSAIGTMGILQHLQAAKEQQDLQKAIAGGDIQTLLRTKGGLAVLKQVNDMQNSGVTAGLHSAQTAEINRKATTADTQQKAVTDLSNLFNPQSPFWTQNGGVAPNEVRAPIPDEHAQDQAAALKLSQMGDTPYSIGVPPQGKVQSLAIQAGNALPREVSKALIKPDAMSPNASGVGSVARAVPGGYIEKQPDGTVKFNPTATHGGAASANTASAGITLDNSALHGQTFLNTLEPDMANKVKAVINYEAPLTTFSARTGGERSAILAMAKQADPSFNAMKYGVRQQVMTDFTKGKTADNIVALDQAINHMGTLDELGKALGNNDVKVINAVVNRIKDETGNPNVNNFNTAKQAVGTELMRVFRQVNASETETKAWENRFSSSNSPEQLKGALQQGVKLLEGRVNALNNRWNRAFDTNTGYPNIFSPEAMTVIQSLGAEKFMNIPQNRAVPTSAVTSPVEFNGYKFPNQEALDKYKKAAGL